MKHTRRIKTRQKGRKYVNKTRRLRNKGKKRMSQRGG